MKRYALPAIALSTALLAACAEQPSTALAPEEPLFAKTGSSKPVTEENPRSIWDWKQSLVDDPTTTDVDESKAVVAIRGDGKVGSDVLQYSPDWYTADATTGQYQGHTCGARATVFWNSNNWGGDATFDPDLEPNFDDGCGPRSIKISLDGGETFTPPIGPHMNVLRIMSVGASGPSPRPQWIQITNLGISQCDRLQWGTPTFDPGDKVWMTDPGKAGIKVTRLQGAANFSARQTEPVLPGNYSRWEVQTVAPHKADCFKSQKGKLVHVGDFIIPFRVVISELPSVGNNPKEGDLIGS